MVTRDSTLPYHRRFRPRSLAEYVGNTSVKDSVFAALRGITRPQVILLQGHAGCGKTSMGRLLAMEYNCEERHELSGACGECMSCLSYHEYIETGDAANVLDLYEYDCSKIGKAESTAIEEDMKSGSITGGWRTYIFDEAHLLTAGAEGGLLKVIEEPPERVLIVLCTTNPENILDTIKSRCQLTLTVTKPTREELCNLLADVCKHENVEFEDRALSAICVQSSYVPRQALTALEAVVTARGKITAEGVQQVLGVIAEELFYNFYELLCTEHINIFAYIRYLGKLKERTNLEAFITNLIDFTLRGLYIVNGVQVDGVDADEIKRYKNIFTKFDSGDIAHILTTLTEIQKGRNFEAQLLLLGYTGLRKPKVATAIPELQAITGGESVYTNMMVEAYTEKRKPDEETIQETIDSSLAPVSMKDLLTQFGAELKEDGTDSI